MDPIGAIILLVLLYFVSFGSRRSALLAMMTGVLYLTEGQNIDIGINFYAIRILSFALMIRVLVRHELLLRDLTPIDYAVLIAFAYMSVVLTLRSDSGYVSNIAVTVDAYCCYFGFRGVVRGEEDLRWLLQKLVILCIPYALLVAIERVRGASVFVFMGGLSAGWMREGVTRCMGSFRYAVSLGTFGASLMPLYFAQWFSPNDRKYAYAGIGICAWLIWASNSGGSFGAAIFAVVGWGFWFLRGRMREVRWSILGAIVVLAVIMKAPVWFILNRVSFGGDAWHRAYLIDVAVRHLSQWWFAGMPIEETAPWFPYKIAVTGGADITNQYLVYGVTAGIGAILLFIRVLAKAYSQLGLSMRKLAALGQAGGIRQMMIWGLGVMLTVHVVSFLGISYFDQLYVVWFLQLAVITGVTGQILQAQLPAARPVAREARPARAVVVG